MPAILTKLSKTKNIPANTLKYIYCEVNDCYTISTGELTITELDYQLQLLENGQIEYLSQFVSEQILHTDIYLRFCKQKGILPKGAHRRLKLFKQGSLSSTTD